MSAYKLEISLKRIQTFIFEVPRLKAMLGANALIGHTMRHELTELINGHGKKLAWTGDTKKNTNDDPLNKSDPDDRDDPGALYEKGILARDGGHFIAVFDNEEKAEEFKKEAERCLANYLPGVLYDIEITPFADGEKQDGKKTKSPQEIHLTHLPVLQICQETGRAPASKSLDFPGEPRRWISASVSKRQEWGEKFYAGETKDIIGLLHEKLYPDGEKNWIKPKDIEKLTSGGYLALIHADGNSIGQRYKNFSKPKTEPAVTSQTVEEVIRCEARGESFYHSMRVAVRKAVRDAVEKTFGKNRNKHSPEKIRPYEVLMLGGDDLLLACRADKAVEFALNYARALQSQPQADRTLADGKDLHVAIGVAIAKHTYPLHRLQELAESLASSAKRLYRAMGEDKRQSVIDWQVVTQSWFDDPEAVRQKSEEIHYAVDGRTETLLLSRRPYPVVGEDGLEELVKDASNLNAQDEKAARSALRALRSACEQGRLSGEMAFERLPDHVREALGSKRQAVANSPAASLPAHVTEVARSKLWDEIDGMHYTRALDTIGIYEIDRLGRKKDD